MKNVNDSPKATCSKTGLNFLGQICKARRDPSEFAQFAFVDSHGGQLRQAAVHRELQAFLSAHDRAMIELPRDHGKSMQLCIRLIWELGRRPDLRIKLVCATEAIAAERGRFLRQAIQTNPFVHLVFSDLHAADPWTDTRFTITRPAEAIGPSVTALGIGAALTGTRADLLVCDDVVDVRSICSAADRERAKTYFRENLVNLLEPGGRIWTLFTPWHRDDLNAELKKNDSYALFRRAIGDDLEPVWPEKWPRERLEERRREIGATAFARAYRLVCVPDERAGDQTRNDPFLVRRAPVRSQDPGDRSRDIDQSRRRFLGPGDAWPNRGEANSLPGSNRPASRRARPDRTHCQRRSPLEPRHDSL